jgi:hypothetical protein
VRLDDNETSISGSRRDDVTGVGSSSAYTAIHQMTALTSVKLQLFKDFGNANSSTRGLPCTHAGDIDAPSAGNAGLVVIHTHLSLGF